MQAELAQGEANWRQSLGFAELRSLHEYAQIPIRNLDSYLPTLEMQAVISEVRAGDLTPTGLDTRTLPRVDWSQCSRLVLNLGLGSLEFV